MPEEQPYDLKPAAAPQPEHPLASAVKQAQDEREAPKTENSPEQNSDEQLEDIRRNRGIAALAYVGPMVFVPLVWARESCFARHHTNQGLILFLIEACVWGCFQAIGRLFLPLLSIRVFFWPACFISGCLWGLFVLLSVFGILHAVSGSYAKLPAIGQYNIVEE
ncbi:MAG TPA: hypothetical protein VMG59_06790 [Phycisphaerae bacterium]|nr:hypothetical protein [Phycisphaerae bacterium]